jgi:hypothetical protein
LRKLSTSSGKVTGCSARSFAYPRAKLRNVLGVSDADQLVEYVLRYLSCSKWRRVSAAIADRSAGPCGTVSHN